jgi:FAD/FMN-containing dehydrogenase
MPSETRLTGRVVLPSDPDYDSDRMASNQRFDIHPSVLVFCQTVDDVVKAVQWARENGVQISMRGGRHSYEALSMSEGIVIDVSDMNRVQIDKVKKTAVVEAGTQLMPLYEALWQEGLTIPGGSCATVGIAGVTLGGGYGLLSRQMGLTCDSLLAVQMVNAKGEIITANETQNSDLLWACRGGGGGNFGVVTSLTFKLHSISNVAIYTMEWPWQQIREVIAVWQKWAPSVADGLTCVLKLFGKGTGKIASTGLFVGSQQKLDELLKPLKSVGTPSKFTVETVSYLEAARRFAGVKDTRNQKLWMVHWHSLPQTPQVKFKAKSDYAFKPLSNEGIETIVRFLAIVPSGSDLIQFDSYGGAIARIPKEATAFPHRAGTLYSIQYMVYWRQPQDEDKCLKWIRDFYAAMRPYVSGAAYSNYCDLDLINWESAYYGSNFPRLVKVKAAYDPENMFYHPQSIPPALRRMG